MKLSEKSLTLLCIAAIGVLAVVLILSAKNPWRQKSNLPDYPTVRSSSSAAIPKRDASAAVAILSRIGVSGNDRTKLEHSRGKLQERTAREPGNAYAFTLLAAICSELDDCQCQKRAAVKAHQLALEMEGYGGLNIEAIEEMERGCL